MKNGIQTMKTSWVVVKFGGTSVSSALRWKNIATIVAQHLAAGRKPFLVCSAPAHVSNMLDTLLEEAVSAKHNDLWSPLTAIYRQLANDLEVDQQIISEPLADLARLLEGISLIREASCRVRAQVMAFGELMLTQLGYAYLKKQFNVEWRDARDLLHVISEDFANEQTRYLSVRCAIEYRPTLVESLAATDIVITQGFIAKNAEGETVLLGRGGSDTSAAYFAANLGASACEIWTDVPGIYTANPRQIPEARLLRRLDYDEAKEIASMGGKVLHPNCVAPVQQCAIPLYVKYTSEPEREGTLISAESDGESVQIKSIMTKSDIFLVMIETVRMWRQVGFLADIFNSFKQHGLSVDLITTSETNVTVSLDRGEKAKDPRVIDALLADINSYARAKLIGPCASISLIGHNIRSILHQLGDVFSVFESQQVHLLSQAANDLNLTFVVDEDQSERIAKRLHTLLIDQNPQHHYFSKTWRDEFGEQVAMPVMWWEPRRKELLELANKSSPLYVYDQKTLAESVQILKSCDVVDQIFYAMKANSHHDILRQFHRLDLNFECVSMNEVDLIFQLFPDITPKKILFTPNFAPKQEYVDAMKKGIFVTVDNLHPLEFWPEIFANKEILVRIDPGHGAGHHRHVNTAGTSSKFGLPLDQLDALYVLLKKHCFKIVGLHAHAGSGILQHDVWQETLLLLTSLIERFSEVKYINVGGGLGIVEKPGQQALDIPAVNASLQSVKHLFPNIELWIEPGRYLVARSGIILAKVTQLKKKGNLTYVGIETGMNSLIRPALYGSYHEIVNLTRFDAPKTQMVNIVGPICETGDTLGYSRLFPETREGDIILIANTGAYGYCMSSHYNLRYPAAEYYL